MSTETLQEMKNILELQKKLHIEEGPASIELRKDRLNRCISMLKEYSDEIIEALQKDFGNRDPKASFFTEIVSTIGVIEHALKNIDKWTKDEKRPSNVNQPLFIRMMMGFLGSKSYIKYQPLGTIGVISPWNFPVNLVLAPLAGIFAAGNRTMIKPSELTPATSEVTKKMFEAYFDKSEAAVFTGDAEIGAAFSALPFDHLLFTGGTQIGKKVMKAASENLVPVTLELGGKSPVIVDEDANLSEVAKKVVRGKTMNAGQICLAPDYLMLPKGKGKEFADASSDAISEMFKDLKYNDDYTSVINERHYERINELVSDAKEKGAEVVQINPADEDFEQQELHKIPPTIVLNPTEDMKIMQEEIFGPVLPVKEYDNFEETVNYVNSKDRPLGLYLFSKDKSKEKKVLDNTTSGGVTLNDVIWHIGQEELPFGGVGPSGTGSYHGYDGFKEFSHAKAVYKQFSADLMAQMMPPYKGKMFESMKNQILKK